MRRWLLFLIFFLLPFVVFAAEPPAPRDVDLKAPDGVVLKATYYAATTPGPGVLLLHMCNSDRKAWEPVGRQLSAAGIHALALDYRGYGESAGERFENDPEKQQQIVVEKWPGDVDAALAYLSQQPGVDKTRIGAGGGSCGVNQAVQVARRHPQVKSLVLLAGPTDRESREFLLNTHWLPIFASAAADDQFDDDAPRMMEWMTELSGNPRNRFVGFKDGKHGTEIFPVHPELPRRIVAWYVETLVTAPADPHATIPIKKTRISEFWTALDEPGGAAKAAQIFHEARQHDPKAYLFPESILNFAAYEKIQAGQVKDAIELCKLNVEAYPHSANTYDSLGDAYAAEGQNELAVQAAKKALELLPGDKSNEARKKAIKESAEQKLEKLKAGSK